ncbi:gene transfer agent family protein [Pseudophaeobacter sp.]|uniref:gene transfer agent family protein n=1 Tax=Pseudophaeobacter sp. TaxID=1971739 RepID=UPI003299102C
MSGPLEQTANPWRGEVALTLNGQPYVLRLTLGALARLEQQLKTGSLVDLVQRFEAGRFSAADILALLAAGLQGGGHRLSAEDLARAGVKGGPVAAAQVAATLLARSFALPTVPTVQKVERGGEQAAEPAAPPKGAV